MNSTLIPTAILQKADKILFVAHLALGDFTYMQNCFRAFKQAYPHIKIHLWVDELRRTNDTTQWAHLKKYSLYDWVNACDMFDKVYSQTYSPALFQESIKQAQAENYPIAVSLAVHRRHTYVDLLRQVAPTGFIVGQKEAPRFYDFPKKLIYKKLDAFIPAYKVTKQQQAGLAPIAHISAIYAGWFKQLFDISMSEQARFPFIDMPKKWTDFANTQFVEWGFVANQPVIFLNGFSKSLDRSWPIERVFELARAIKATQKWQHAGIIINVVPEQMENAKLVFAAANMKNVHLFSATTNFFQLPAVLAKCQLIISVETAVMHLANAVNVPVIALMRQTSPEWTPINAAISTIIKTQHRKAWMDEILVADVMAVLDKQ